MKRFSGKKSVLIISAANDIRRCWTATVYRISYYKNNGNALSTDVPAKALKLCSRKR